MVTGETTKWFWPKKIMGCCTIADKRVSGVDMIKKQDVALYFSPQLHLLTVQFVNKEENYKREKWQK